jgi:hypothetical protein
VVKTSTEQHLQRKRWSHNFLRDWQPDAQGGCSSQTGESATPLHQDVVPPNLREVSAKDSLPVLTVDTKIPPDDNLDVFMGENTPARYVFALLKYIGALLTCCSLVTVQILKDADGDILSGPYSQKDTSGMLDCSICRETILAFDVIELFPCRHISFCNRKVSSRQARYLDPYMARNGTGFSNPFLDSRGLTQDERGGLLPRKGPDGLPSGPPHHGRGPEVSARTQAADAWHSNDVAPETEVNRLVCADAKADHITWIFEAGKESGKSDMTACLSLTVRGSQIEDAPGPVLASLL